MSQSSVLDREYRFKGGTIADMSQADIISRLNSTRQITTVTVNATANPAGVVINSSTYTANAASATTTAAAIANELAYTIEAGDENLKVEVSGAVLTLTSEDGAAVSIASVDTATTTAAVVAYTNSEIAFGTVVAVDTNNDKNAKLPAGTAMITLGIAVEAVTENGSSNSGTGYESDTVMDICEKGTVWARKQVGATFDPGDAVYVRQTTGSSSLDLGILNDGADTATCTLESGIRIVESAASADTFVKVKINL